MAAFLSSHISAWRRLPTSLEVRNALLATIFAILLLLPGFSLLFLIPLSVVAICTGWSSHRSKYGAIALLVAVTVGAVTLMVTETLLQDVLRIAAFDVFFGVLPLLLTTAIRSRRTLAEQETALLRQQEHNRQREIAIIHARERTFLAEELHDDLGHVLSLVALNLGRLELDSNIGTEQRDAVGASRRQVADAVVRLGTSIEALRGDEFPQLMSQHRQVDIEKLIAQARDAGAPIEVIGYPGAERLAHFGASTVFRCIQEGITNAVKHAPRQPITIRFEDEGQYLQITLKNPIFSRDLNDHDHGYGLVALRERVRITGGHIEVKPEENAFILSVRLPLIEDQSASHSDTTELSLIATPTAETHRQITDARRRSVARLWVAVLVPLVVLVAIETTIQAADVLDAHRAKLDAATFSQIKTGDRRSDLEPLLPAQKLEVKDNAASSGQCFYYAITSNPLDNAFGDSYRICFDNEVVISVDRLAQEK